MKRTALNQLYWACRRGMLELDLLLIPFLEDNSPSWSPEQAHSFALLLQEEDQDLFAWLMGASLPPAQHQIWISKIVQSRNSLLQG